ncbi:hypothetical protein [Rhodovulum strictum]|uniref:Uncharacterized protein n=1 Tax=Rhodovulum strictum TaxID=58314 RepID=A0A844B8S0_9RHOB|nr:hypothetical protein [Rhodovulum strictum]MRH22711.1 hypothetical protein [Rhodovulum strictum]
MRRGPAPDLCDLWRQILSGDGIGPEPGQTALEPILDRLAAREQEAEQ